MANTVYDNFLLQNKVTDNLTTKINHNSLMTIDNSLALEEGMIVKVNLYSYTGAVEKVAKGAKNTVRGAISVSTANYEAKVAQQTWDYYDEEFMRDSAIVDNGIKLSSNLMVNDMVNDFYTEAAKATLSLTWPKAGTFSYSTVVDAINLMNLEDESGLFLLINNTQKSEIRKDEDFKSKELGKVIADGAIGTLSGVPVICSKAVPADTAYLLTKDAITCYMKKDSGVEQVRDAEVRMNTIVMSQVNIIALTDATKIVKITKATV